MADTLKMAWVGADGSRWELLDPRSPVFLVSIDGLGMPSLSHYWTKSPVFDGQRYEGTSFDNTVGTMTVQVGDTLPLPGARSRRTGDRWREEIDEPFRRSFSAEVEGHLEVTSRKGTRRLALRLDAPLPFPGGDSNPALIGRAIYAIGLTAGDEPWWTGDPVREEFGHSSDDQAFFTETFPDDDHVGVYVSSDAPTSRAQIRNPGDRRVFPKWWAQGPVDQTTIGVGSDTITLPFSIAADRRIYVDSEMKTITDETGTSLWRLMGYADPTFAPIRAREQVPLSVTLLGAGDGAAVGVEITPRYSGPW